MQRTPLSAFLLILTIATILATLLWRLLGAGQAEPVRAQDDRNIGANARDEIVYIDAAGHIRVWDLTPAGSSKRQILWRSPATDGVWFDLDVGDVNADGDAEIVAIQQATALTSVLAIYDPVITVSNEEEFLKDTSRVINLIPWARLYTITVAGQATLVATGNLDAAIPGDEILYGVINEELQAAGIASHERYGLYLMRRRLPCACEWENPIEILATEPAWTQLRIANIDQEGNDEIGLVAEREGWLHIYRINGNSLQQLFESESEARPWLSMEIGQLDGGLAAEVIAGRRADSNLPTFWAFRYAPSADGYFVDRYSELFAPPPRHLFFADVNGNGDEEAFILRNSPTPPPRPTPTALPRPHLIMRNRGPDTTLIPFEVILDADSGYQLGAGGDVDDDRRDEVVIARANAIRIYTDPESNATLVNTQPFTTNLRSLRVANLDVNGYLKLLLFQSSPTNLTVTLPAGIQASQVATVAVRSDVPGREFAFASAVEDSPTWLGVNPVTGTTPLILQVLYNSYGLAALTTYTATIQMTPIDAGIVSVPNEVQVTLRTTPGLWPQPSSLSTVVPCAQPALIPTPVQIGGLLGVAYNASLFAVGTEAAFAPHVLVDAADPTVEWPSTVTWATLSGASTLLPTTLTVTLNPALRGATLEQATLRVQANDNLNQLRTIDIPVQMACAAYSLYFPLIGR